MLVYPPTPGFTKGPPVAIGTTVAVPVAVDDVGVVVFPLNWKESANNEIYDFPSPGPKPSPPQIWLTSPLQGKLQFLSSTLRLGMTGPPQHSRLLPVVSYGSKLFEFRNF